MISSASAPLRILHVVGRMNRGGAESLIMNIYRVIDRTKVQFDFSVNTTQESHFDKEILALGGRIFSHPVPSVVGIRRYATAFANTLRTHGPFAGLHSHVHHFSGILLKKGREAGIPIRIAHSHNTVDGQKTTLPRTLYRWGMRRLLFRHGTILFGCSKRAAEILYGGKCWADNRVQVLPNAVDLRVFQRVEGDRGALRQIVELPENAHVVGHVGRFDPQKNHRQLINLFAHLLRSLPSAHLILIGDGPLRVEIESLVTSLNIQKKVHFLGIRSDVPKLMAGMDLFFLPSLYEGLPVVLVEAQAAGLACVASSSITREVDVRLGLLQYIGLEDESSAWTDAVIRGLSVVRPTFDKRVSALKQCGFDLAAVVTRLERLYCGH